MKIMITILALLLVSWFTEDVWANCYVMNLGQGDKIHDCDNGQDSGFEMSYGDDNEDGVIFRHDGLLDDVLGLGDGFAVIFRGDGRIDDVIGLGDGNGIIFHDGTWIDDEVDLSQGDALSLR